jgi:hypothetical protein
MWILKDEDFETILFEHLKQFTWNSIHSLNTNNIWSVYMYLLNMLIFIVHMDMLVTTDQRVPSHIGKILTYAATINSDQLI